MTEPIGQLASGMDSLMQQYLTTSNNIANATTSGFKRMVSSFSADLNRQLQDFKDVSPAAGEVKVNQDIDFSQGQIVPTGRTLDIALEGKGFVALETPTGPLYTRTGSLNVNALGQLVDSADHLVAGDNGPILIPQNVSTASVQIAGDGTVLADGQQVGKIRIVNFTGGTGMLRPVGFGAYEAPQNAVTEPAAQTRVRQGFQESSNVRTMEEVVNLITLSRIYESHVNILKKQTDNANALLGVANG